MISGHGTEKLFSMEFEILGLAHPSAIIFLVNNIANNDIVMMITKVMITKRNERMEPKSQNLSITSSSEIFYTSC